MADKKDLSKFGIKKEPLSWEEVLKNEKKTNEKPAKSKDKSEPKDE